MSLRNNLISGEEGKDVAAAAGMMVTDNAMLSDLSRSKDTLTNPAHPSVTWLRCVHQFDSRFSQFVRSQNEFDLSNSCGHDPQQMTPIHIPVPDFSYNQDYSLFFIVHEVVCTIDSFCQPC